MNKPPKLLYHYASIDAFKGIVNNEHLRMTHYAQMNDPLEVKKARDILINSIKQYKCQTQHEKFKEFLVEELKHYKDLDIFVTSFSEKSDYLEQWRAYTPTGGVSIGFKGEELDNGFIQECLPEGEYLKEKGIVSKPNKTGWTSVRHPRLHQCQYSGKEKKYKKTKEDIDERVTKWFTESAYPESSNRLVNNKPKVWDRVILSGLNANIFYIICKIKHSAYSGEKEWRWVNVSPKIEKFRKYIDEKNREYVKAKIHPEDFIKEVWISPHGDKKTIKRVLEFYKEKHKLTFKIRQSKIPYRL